MTSAARICSLVLTLLTAIGCGGDTPTSPTTTDTTTTATAASPAFFEDFAGTLPVSGESFYSFTVTQYGTVNVTLSSIGGMYVPSTVMVSLGLGTPSGETCTAGSPVNIAASAGPHLSESYQPGVYCVRIADIGNLYAPAQFLVSIAYP
jgi:hypothetical protein